MFQRYLIVCCLLLCCLSIFPQNKDKPMVMRKLDSILDAHTKIRVDTNYISRPTTNWTLKVRGRGYTNFVSVKGDMDGIGTFDSKIYAPLKTTIGFSANYRGLSISLAVNPAKLLGKNSSRNINLTLYNNRFGVDFSYSSTDDLTTMVLSGENKKEMRLTDSYLQQLSVSAYYIFNDRKFSYPAAFTHSWIQRRSAGSFLVSAGLYIGRINSSFDDMTGQMPLDKSLVMKHVSIGGGYAYNYAPNKHWLLHFSLVPHIIVWHNYRYSLSLDQETHQPLEKKIQYKFPGFQGIGRFAMTYSWKKYFTGFSSVVQSSFVGIGNKEISAGNTQVKYEVFLGIRL